mmetsp:Transcript_19613/g.30731  ORF Transcript_19613/g.30731 Transcript_19613/m.30731 type:complete len:204 (-) Transcript_19613:172-783(-)|eukprot:CAMPEP_0184307938 /NCGR_PEP_ID=MMETSP1049-20130417/16538_1 /TAXON_ID=77928 /ORGANISM="Proteomonas sulcata, Strain CCMP704" /LENGTH=203 /DNA_ID=CAMNT_0026620529 /DNA_START=50 /DNA_END=661 /DNA_ORIENTATION=+
MAEQEDAPLFQLTKRVREAVSLINALDESKLSVVVKRLVKGVGTKSESVFSEGELEQLQEHLSLTSAELDTVLEACSFFLERSAYHVVKAPDLSAHLQAAGVAQTHARAFSAVWQSEAPELLQRLRSAQLSGIPALQHVDWALHLQAASSSQTKVAEPRVVMNLNLSTAEDDRKLLPMEFTHEQLKAFLDRLDLAQKQLDALS